MINNHKRTGIFVTKERKNNDRSVTEIWLQDSAVVPEQQGQHPIATAHSVKAAEEWVKIFENVPDVAMVEFYDTTTGTQLLSYLARLGYRIVSHQIAQNNSDRVWHYLILQHSSDDN